MYNLQSRAKIMRLYVFQTFFFILTRIIRSFLTISPLPPLTMLGECFQPTPRFSIVKTTLFWGEVGGGEANRMSQ